MGERERWEGERGGRERGGSRGRRGIEREGEREVGGGKSRGGEGETDDDRGIETGGRRGRAEVVDEGASKQTARDGSRGGEIPGPAYVSKSVSCFCIQICV